jgi:HK97 family phage prohead protease
MLFGPVHQGRRGPDPGPYTAALPMRGRPNRAVFVPLISAQQGDALKDTRPGDAALLPPARSRQAPTIRDARITGGGGIAGYASLFGVEDQGRDVVMPGAFRASLARRPASNVRLLFQHDPAQPIGVWDEIREDTKGLYVRGRLIEEVARAREVMALIRAGALDGLSIGFHAKKAARDAATGQRRLHEIDLWEISIVTFPMLPGARVAAMKTGATAAFPLTRPDAAPRSLLLAGPGDDFGLAASRRALPARERKARPGGGLSAQWC